MQTLSEVVIRKSLVSINSISLPSPLFQHLHTYFDGNFGWKGTTALTLNAYCPALMHSLPWAHRVTHTAEALSACPLSKAQGHVSLVKIGPLTCCNMIEETKGRENQSPRRPNSPAVVGYLTATLTLWPLPVIPPEAGQFTQPNPLARGSASTVSCTAPRTRGLSSAPHSTPPIHPTPPIHKQYLTFTPTEIHALRYTVCVWYCTVYFYFTSQIIWSGCSCPVLFL